MFLGSLKNMAGKAYQVKFRLIFFIIICVLMVYSFSYAVTAKNVYTIIDGNNSIVVETYSSDVESAIAKAGITLGADDSYAEEADENGIPSIRIIRKRIVTVHYDGGSSILFSTAGTVSGVLEQLEITLGEYDFVSVFLNDPIYNGMEITVTRIEVIYDYITQQIPYETVIRENPNTKQDSVIQQGAYGETLSTYKAMKQDGIIIEEFALIGTETLSEPVTEIIERGTFVEKVQAPVVSKDKTASTVGKSQSADSGGGSTSGGAVTTASGEVISYTKSLTCTATAYTGENGDSMRTATGTTVRYGAIAVDPTVIPYGTRMYILGSNGKWVYGYAVAEDCGGSVKGNKIDLFFDTYDECVQFGVQTATVYILN